jgi:hypothetical protein
MAYNRKVNNDGTYRNVCGWTVISPIIGDMKFIQNYINKNININSYFSALPSSSYHVTVYGIWSNGSKLLKQQQKYIDNCLSCDKKDELYSSSISTGFFNPDNCLNKLFTGIVKNCNDFRDEYSKTKNTITLTVKHVYFNETIGIIFEKNDDIDEMDKIRNTIIKTCKKKIKDGLYHMTLAYKYKNITEKDNEKIIIELNILNMLLSKQTITFDLPVLMLFDDMTHFYLFTK